MAYLYILVAVAVLFVVLHKLTELSMRDKSLLAGGLFLLVTSFYFFEQSNKKATHNKHEILFAFNHGKDLLCTDKTVNNKLYNYASRSFIGKKGSTVFSSKHIPISECVVKL